MSANYIVLSFIFYETIERLEAQKLFIIIAIEWAQIDFELFWRHEQTDQKFVNRVWNADIFIHRKMAIKIRVIVFDTETKFLWANFNSCKNKSVHVKTRHNEFV